LGAFGFASLAACAFLPPPPSPPQVTIVSADGVVLATRSLGPDRRFMGAYISTSGAPSYVWQAIIAIEDRRFFTHWGIDPTGIVRAAIANLRRGRKSQGGSTITQQLARNLYLTQTKSWTRKAIEIVLAIALELRWGKHAILERYLNTIYFGHDAYGIAAAAELYFGKPPKRLELAEAAMLAGLIQAPERLSPLKHLKNARTRADRVLEKMVEQGFISRLAYQNARWRLAKLSAAHETLVREYAVEAILDELHAKVAASVLESSRLIVRTTINTEIQAAAEHAVARNLQFYGSRLDSDAAALAAVGHDGAIHAMVGGTDFRSNRFNLATHARRQPGSSFKPFLYLAALEAGATPDTLVPDAPDRSKDWFPQNASRTYSYQSVPLHYGLAHSLNSVAARLCYAVGPAQVTEVARRLGIESRLQPDVTIALGTSDVTVVEMAAAYSAFANGGFRVHPWMIAEVRDENARVRYRAPVPDRLRVIAPRELTMMNAMLREVVQAGTGSRAAIPDHDVAGKTGTTQRNRDAWFVGYAGTLTAAVWLGNIDGEPMRSAAVSQFAAKMWGDFMRSALSHRPMRPDKTAASER
jgi:penicillin-binding protein 1A